MSSEAPPGYEKCSFCNKISKKAGGGHTNHLKACMKKIKERQERDEMLASAYQDRQAHLRRLHDEEMSLRERSIIPAPSASAGDGEMRFEPDYEMNIEPDDMFEDLHDNEPLDATAADAIEEPADRNSQPNAQSNPAVPESLSSYIKVEYHPRARLPPKIIDPNEENDRPLPPEPLLSPFAPFASLADFEIAERVVNTKSSSDDIDFWLKTHHHPRFIEPGASKIGFTSAKKLLKCVDAFVDLHPGFTEKTFKVPHTLKDGTDVELTYSVWVKDPMPWIEELVGDPSLKDHWTWHAEKRFICEDGKEPERFITSPMNADFAWETETTLPLDNPNHVQFPLIYYSDKSNAARFAQFSLWPLLLRPANLSKEIADQNSSYAGNTLFALFPKITCPAGDKGNERWPALARRIFHIASKLVFMHISHASKHGKTMHCGDGLDRTIYPLISIADLDLEEQFLCAAHQGTNATHPCPKCLVLNADQSKLTMENTARSHESSKAVIKEARRLDREGRKTQVKETLKSVSLYMIDNAWWSLGHTDIHRALSFDILHTIWLGTWGAHLLPLLTPILSSIQGLSQNNHYVASERFRGVPSFPNMRLVHNFNEIEFADGKTYYSILQQILPIVHDLVPDTSRPFLKLIRILAEITVRTRMKMQRESDLLAGEALVAQFSELLPRVSILTQKNFNFPKIHQLSHLFQDIRQKGPSHYLDCMVGENFHQGLIASYAASNKREALRQILQRESRVLAMSRVRWRLNVIAYRLGARIPIEVDPKDANADSDDDDDPPEGDQEIADVDKPPFQEILLGSLDRPDRHDSRKSTQIEQRGGYFPLFLRQPQYSNFHRELLSYLDTLRREYRDASPELLSSQALNLNVHRQIKYTYYSKDDCLPYRERIRCAPSFHEKQRFDTVLVLVGDSFRPARLHLVFNVKAYEVKWQLARVTYFTELPSSALDRTIGMRRYEEELTGEFIHLASIIRSCYMCPIFSDPSGRQFYMNDLAGGDTDLFLRLR